MQRLRQSGFTLLETIAVLAILAILSAISLPPIMRLALEQPRLDEAKNKLNTAISECLRIARDRNINLASVRPPSLASAAALPGQYTYANNMINCNEISLRDAGGRLPGLSFSIIDGKVFKESSLAVNGSDYRSDCDQWGNCNNSRPETRALKACALEKQTCDSRLSSRINTGPNGMTVSWSGSCTFPRTPTTGCLRDTWIYNQRIYYSLSDYNNAIGASQTQACNNYRIQEQSRSRRTPATPIESGLPNACQTRLYWINGQEIDTCNYDYESWKQSTRTGLYTPTNNSCTAARTAVKCVLGGRTLVFEGTTSCPAPWR